MAEAVLIKNLQNNSVLRCKLSEKFISLGLLNGKNMRGIAVPLESILEKSPAYDMFTKNVLKSGFKQSHIDELENLVVTSYSGFRK